MTTLRKFRENVNLTQKELSEYLGVSQQAVAAWESGQRIPRAAILPKLAEIFGCKIDDLFRSLPS